MDRRCVSHEKEENRNQGRFDGFRRRRLESQQARLQPNGHSARGESRQRRTVDGWMDADAEAKVAKSARWTNTDELKYPSDFYAVMRLMKQHGDAKLSQILATFRPLGFICPQCNGTGTVREKYATDSLAVATGCAEWSYRDAECTLCRGTGAVAKKLKPKMVQDGWEEA